MKLFGIFAAMILTVIFISNIISITNPTTIIIGMSLIVASYIIMLTAHDNPQEVVEGLEAGADDFIAKPFNPET